MANCNVYVNKTYGVTGVVYPTELRSSPVAYTVRLINDDVLFVHADSFVSDESGHLIRFSTGVKHVAVFPSSSVLYVLPPTGK